MDSTINQDSPVKADYHSGYVAIVGWPNVGKSTLTNALIGRKLSIISKKPQTTRDAIRGILTENNHQAIFIDTPGWLNPKDPFQTHMKTEIVRALREDSEIVLWVMEPKSLGENEKELGRLILQTGRLVFVAINKMDQPQSGDGVSKLKAFLQTEFHLAPEKIFEVSAEKKTGVDALRKALLLALPTSPPYFPEDQLTDQWERDFVAELIREQIFARFQEEVPHASCVVIEEFREKPGQKDFIQAAIVVETEGQRRIIVGKNGSGIRDLGAAARKEIEQQLTRPVFLQLMVKIHKNWRKDSLFLKQLSNDSVGDH